MTIYGDDHRDLQDAFDARRLADRLAETIVRDTIAPQDQAFIESREFFFLSTLMADGEPTVSFKAARVSVLDERTIAFPSYNGNGMFLSTGNIRRAGKVGLLFIDFERPNRLRFQGTASVTADDSLLGNYPEAELLVRVNLSRLWVNCPRYIPKLQKVADSPHMPKAGHTTPVADWKRIEGLQDILPASDRERLADTTPLTPEAYAALLKGD